MRLRLLCQYLRAVPEGDRDLLIPDSLMVARIAVEVFFCLLLIVHAVPVKITYPLYYDASLSNLNILAVRFDIRTESATPMTRTTGNDQTGLQLIKVSAYPAGISSIASEW